MEGWRDGGMEEWMEGWRDGGMKILRTSDLGMDE
jgi:hypothetical protein